MNLQLISFLTSSILLIGLATPVKSSGSVKSETVLAKVQRTGTLNLAMREDASPFGYLDANGNVQGYCLDFFALLKQQLAQELNRKTLSIKLLKSTSENRFALVGNNTVDLECGPNTIRADIPENTDFSATFFVTGTQFLIKEKNRDRFPPEQDSDALRLGVINNTTTADFIAKKYPSATITRYSGVTARTRGVQAVEQEKIDAMISDGILLRAAAQQQELSAAQYPLVPETPLTCDRYGLILKGEDSQWQDFVNSVVNSNEAKELSNAWFGNLFDYSLPTKDLCQ